MVAIYFAYYNPVGLADRVWSLEELVGLLEQKAQGAAT